MLKLLGDTLHGITSRRGREESSLELTGCWQMLGGRIGRLAEVTFLPEGNYDHSTGLLCVYPDIG